MKRKYRIRTLLYQGWIETEETVTPMHIHITSFLVQVRRWYGWVTVKEFCDTADPDFARREAEELLEILEG